MVKRGTVILVPFPFTDLSGNKVRPAIVVSAGKVGRNVVVVFITSQVSLQEKYTVAVMPDDDNGLKVPSGVVCSKIATLDAKIVLGELGVIGTATQEKIDTELRLVLGL